MQDAPHPSAGPVRSACRPRERSAVEEELRRAAPEVQRLVSRLVHRRAREDAAAEAMLALLEARLSGGALSPELVQRRTRNAADRQRRAGWVRRLVLGPVDEEVAPLAVERDPLLAARMADALGTLSPKLREVLVLIELEERTRVEVASMLGVSSGTVASRLRLAKQRLRPILEAEHAQLSIATSRAAGGDVDRVKQRGRERRGRLASSDRCAQNT